MQVKSEIIIPLARKSVSIDIHLFHSVGKHTAGVAVGSQVTAVLMTMTHRVLSSKIELALNFLRHIVLTSCSSVSRYSSDDRTNQMSKYDDHMRTTKTDL